MDSTGVSVDDGDGLHRLSGPVVKDTQNQVAQTTSMGGSCIAQHTQGAALSRKGAEQLPGVAGLAVGELCRQQLGQLPVRDSVSGAGGHRGREDLAARVEPPEEGGQRRGQGCRQHQAGGQGEQPAPPEGAGGPPPGEGGNPAAQVVGGVDGLHLSDIIPLIHRQTLLSSVSAGLPGPAAARRGPCWWCLP